MLITFLRIVAVSFGTKQLNPWFVVEEVRAGKLNKESFLLRAVWTLKLSLLVLIFSNKSPILYSLNLPPPCLKCVSSSDRRGLAKNPDFAL